MTQVSRYVFRYRTTPNQLWAGLCHRTDLVHCSSVRFANKCDDESCPQSAQGHCLPPCYLCQTSATTNPVHSLHKAIACLHVTSAKQVRRRILSTVCTRPLPASMLPLPNKCDDESCPQSAQGHCLPPCYLCQTT